MRLVARTLAVLAATGCVGCALRVSDARGRVTTIGLVWSTQPGPAVAEAAPRLVLGAERQPDAPRWIELRAAGAVFERTPHSTGITLGYRDSLWVFPAAGAVTAADSGRKGEPARVEVFSP
jgi:hypothetical protein